MRYTILQFGAVLAIFSWQPAFSLEVEALTELLEGAREEMHLPGLRAAVRFPDGHIVRAAAGVAEEETNKPLDNEIGMPGGSTGKSFAAALTMLLVEDEVLSLDDPAKKWLGNEDWFHDVPNADDIRLRHLLSHSAGIGDYPGRAGFAMRMVGRTVRHGSAYFTPEELIRIAGKKPLFPAGQGYAYTDAGYLVLGRVIEAATGDTYYELLQKRILEPHGLDQVRPQVQSVLPNIAVGYQRGSRNLKKDGRMKFDPRSEWTGGGLVTNPTMLAMFFGALADGCVVQPDSLAQMLEAGWREPNGEDFHYGFGLFVHNDGEWFGHAGMWVGYRSHVTHLVPSGITIAVQTNQDDRTDMVGLVRRIAELAASQPDMEDRLAPAELAAQNTGTRNACRATASPAQ